MNKVILILVVLFAFAAISLPQFSKVFGAGSYSLNFNGSTDYAQAPDDPELNITGDWTVEAWFKDTTPGGYNHDNKYILTKGDSNINSESPFLMYVGWNYLNVGLRSGWTNRTVQYNMAAAGVSTNTWHHAAATFVASSKTLTLYLDGVQVAQGVLSPSSSGNTLPISIGRNGNTGMFWQGNLDDLRVWNVARTGSQIQSSYLSEFTSPPTGLVGNWRFNEGTGITAFDSTLPAEDATLKGTATWSTNIH